MPRTYAKWLTSITSDADFLAMSMPAKFLYSMLVAMPKLSAAGCIDYRPRRWAELDSSFTPDAVQDVVAELAAARFVVVDEDTEEVLIRSFIKVDGGFNNTNLRKSIEAATKAIESERLRAIADNELARATGNPHVTDPEPRPDGRRRGGDREATSILHPSPSTVHPAAPLDSAHGVDSFDAAVDAAVEIRRGQAGKISHPSSWATKTRDGIITDFGRKIRARLDEGHQPGDAARIALDLCEPFPPRRPMVESHPSTCVCGGTGWVETDPDADRSDVERCTFTPRPELRLA